MKTLGLIALAAAGVGFLIYTEKGRALTGQAGQALRDAGDRLRGDAPVERLVHDALERPHPDTAVAHAFEEAGAM